MNDIGSFVRLKYEIITDDYDTWHLCETYPSEVRSKWNWRCAESVEHLAKRHHDVEKCIEVAKRYKNGLATDEEIKRSFYIMRTGRYNIHEAVIRNAAYSAYYAAYGGSRGAARCRPAQYAAYAAGSPSYNKPFKEQFQIYINWLIEELCNFELQIK